MKNIKHRAISSMRWTSLMRYFLMAINIFGGIYLARTISPEIFGQVGLNVAILGLVTMASMWGYVAAFVKTPGRSKDNLEYLGTLLTIDVIVSGITLLICLVIALLDQQRFGILLIVLIIAKIPMYYTEIYRASLVKDMEFNRIFYIHFTASFLSMTTACVMAYQGFGVWALLARFALDDILSGFLSMVFVNVKVRFRFNKQMAIDFFHFGKYAFVSSALDGGYTNIDRISVGSLIGNAFLGFYERAHSIAAYVNDLLWDAVSSVFDSLFGNLKDDRRRLSRVFNLGSCFFFE